MSKDMNIYSLRSYRDLPGVKDRSRTAVLQVLACDGASSRAHIAEVTKLSAMTVKRAADQLILEGIVQEHSYAAPDTGRRCKVLSIQADAPFLVLDLTSRHMTAHLINSALIDSRPCLLPDDPASPPARGRQTPARTVPVTATATVTYDYTDIYSMSDNLYLFLSRVVGQLLQPGRDSGDIPDNLKTTVITVDPQDGLTNTDGLVIPHPDTPEPPAELIGDMLYPSLPCSTEPPCPTNVDYQTAIIHAITRNAAVRQATSVLYLRIGSQLYTTLCIRKDVDSPWFPPHGDAIMRRTLAEVLSVPSQPLSRLPSEEVYRRLAQFIARHGTFFTPDVIILEDDRTVPSRTNLQHLIRALPHGTRLYVWTHSLPMAVYGAAQITRLTAWGAMDARE